MQCELLIKGGEVIDPAQDLRGRLDVALGGGKVLALAEEISGEGAAQVYDAGGKLVLPGLIDMHCHLGAVHGEPAGEPDVIGLRQGVTTLGEGGSLGCRTFDEVAAIEQGQQTEVRWFVNLAARGLKQVPEIASEADVDFAGTERLLKEHGDKIAGIKLRAIGTVAHGMGLRAVELSQQLAKGAGLPLLVHVGVCFSELNDERALKVIEGYSAGLLDLMEAGDIVSHVYSPKRGNLLAEDGTVLPQLERAIKRGVLMEVAHGRTNFGSPTALSMMAQGVRADIVSTDASVFNLPGAKTTVPSGAHSAWFDEEHPEDGVYFLVHTMAKMLAFGYSLEEVVAMATVTPARVLAGKGSPGTLKVGVQADVTVLEALPRTSTYWDGLAGTCIEGKVTLLPRAVVKAHGAAQQLTDLTRL